MDPNGVRLAASSLRGFRERLVPDGAEYSGDAAACGSASVAEAVTAFGTGVRSARMALAGVADALQARADAAASAWVAAEHQVSSSMRAGRGD